MLIKLKENYTKRRKIIFKKFKAQNSLKVKAEVLSNIVTYLPSLTSSIKARPAFFCIEFCHSWIKTKQKRKFAV